MNPGSSQKLRAWDDFARRVLDSRAAWTVTDDGGPLAAHGVDGSEAQPFWSSRGAANRMLEAMSATGPTHVVRVSLDEFVSRTLLTLAAANVLVGVDWATDRQGWVFHADPIRHELRRLIRLRLN